MDDIEAASLQLVGIDLDNLSEIINIENRAYSMGWTEQMFKDCLNNQYRCSALVKANIIIGYFVIQIILDEFHILNICIDPKFHRQGYGMHLLKSIKDIANNKQMNSILLEVRPSNKAARKLYRNFGFERSGIRKRYYPIDIKVSTEREDALLMEYMLE